METSSTSSAPATVVGSDGTRFDEGAELHAPELYRPTSTAPQVDTLADIGPAEIAFYREHGYLSVRQAYTPAEVDDAMAGLSSLVMGEKPDFKDVYFEAAARDRLPQMKAEERLDAVRKLGCFVDHEARLKAISHHAQLLSVVTRLLDDQEPEMFQDMALLKPPRIGREKPWHQDHAYFDYPLDAKIVGVWIALDEATIDNGCMQLLPGRHREGPQIHFKRRDWQICDKAVLGQESVAAPLKPGGLLLFDAKLPHGTPHNTSPNRRRALQFHYAPTGLKNAPTAERLEHFGSEGKNVSC
ncbi:phytanoyl-CoA dioxygenase family protein [Synoicihabitans lomoniglobus]|uniref:Phytanoyl-CoA dioxygenase family protein n=1 Tax=Synoicihabitans lomoniglobus TaxID=2909285 RepID=A0AAF0CND9_9BACT|nr:phytanoyl-CoA dioxygenase family protein [Opitutaceae bacterium LMO-M01]WED65388.1 phytanoyl-CoA dioxygenase family protein [Opitutaceae bacterium LMO-M01]